MPEAGDVLAARYELVRELGRGAAAVVFLARDAELDRPVAVKLLTGEGAIASPQRFLFEARALAGLEHPHIVTIYDHGLDAGVPYLVLERMEGGSLQGQLGKGPLPPPRVREVGEALLAALEHAHGKEVLHRDVKPDNVLLTREGHPKLTDFGLAKASSSGIRTRTGVIVGTPEFMAPEVFTGQPSTAASDLYAWGCVSYLLLNGRLPFVGNLSEIAQAKLSGIYEHGREVGPLRAAVRRALSLQPANRGSAGELLQILGGEGLEGSRMATRAVPRVVATHSSPAVETAGPRRGPGRALAFAALLALGGAYLAGRAGFPAPSRPAPPTPASTSPGPSAANRDLSGLVERWRHFSHQLAPEELIADLQAGTLPRPGLMDTLLMDFPQKHMVAAYRRQGTRADLGYLQAAADRLPLRAELRQDRKELTAALGDERAPFEQRLELFLHLQPLVFVDALYESWGLALPYRIRGVLDGLVRVRSRGPPHEIEPAPPVPAGGRPGPGRHLLFAWRDEVRDWPLLFPSEGEPAEYERIAYGQYVKESDGRWIPEEHMGIRSRVRLRDVDALRDHELAVTMQVGGLFTATEIELTWNGVSLHYPAEPDRATHVYWNNEEIPEYLVEFELPGELLREGPNDFGVETRSLPGVPRCCGVGLDRVELVVGPRSRR